MTKERTVVWLVYAVKSSGVVVPSATVWIPIQVCLSEAGARKMAKMMSEATGDRFEVQEVEVSP